MTESLEARVDRALAYEEIRQLAYRYSVSCDSRDIETLVGLWADGAHFGGVPFTKAEIADMFSNMLAAVPLMILNVGNHVIDFDDADHAHGTVYARCEIEWDAHTWAVQQVVYLDQYVRQEGKWYFLTREHLLYYGSDLLQRPIGLPPTGVPENGLGKGSMPQPWPTYRAFFERHPDARHY
jgi:hypothetical protein